MLHGPDRFFVLVHRSNEFSQENERDELCFIGSWILNVAQKSKRKDANSVTAGPRFCESSIDSNAVLDAQIIKKFRRVFGGRDKEVIACAGACHVQ